MEINVSPYFEKQYKKIPKNIKKKAKEKEKIFRENCFDAQLKTHKLKARNNVWAFWIDYHYRIKFIFISDNEVLFLHIGTHDIYK